MQVKFSDLEIGDKFSFMPHYRNLIKLSADKGRCLDRDIDFPVIKPYWLVTKKDVAP